MNDMLYLYNVLLLPHCDRLWGDRDRDLEQLQEPEREEEYEYLLLLGGERDTEGEDLEEEQDEELELLLERQRRYLERKEEDIPVMNKRKLKPPEYDDEDDGLDWQSNLFLDGECDLDRDLEEWESDSELLDMGLGERWDLLFLDRPVLLSLGLDLGLGVREAPCRRYDLPKGPLLEFASLASVSSRAGEASGVSSIELSSTPSGLWSRGFVSGTYCVLVEPAAFVVDWADDIRAAVGVCVVVAAGLMGLIVIKDCCLTFQRLPGSPVLLLGRQ